jgi:hypothetical protein
MVSEPDVLLALDMQSRKVASDERRHRPRCVCMTQGSLPHVMVQVLLELYTICPTARWAHVSTDDPWQRIPSNASTDGCALGFHDSHCH